MKEDQWEGSVLLNVIMIAIVITMLMFMDTVCMVDFPTLEDK